MAEESFENMLTGGHPNSLGRTVEVVNAVFENPSKIEELYQCYFSEDEIVRLRTSSAFKRICKEKPEWLEPYIDKFLTEISAIDQASAQWTLAILFDMLLPFMSTKQVQLAEKHMRRNLEDHNDWIVLNTTMQVLAEWSESKPELQKWLKPRLELLKKDPRKSVNNRALKLLASLYP